ncbi:hypothetical protein HanLR1_Chr05g0177991 [Helianthus annuus]|nr:hypothetical protein HanLR1_Chr05g0177991 [Helianthus annuus]
MVDLENLFGETLISKLELDNPLYLHASDSTNLTKNLLITEPLPSVKEAFSIISREESHRKSNASMTKEQNVGFFSKYNIVIKYYELATRLGIR